MPAAFDQDERAAGGASRSAPRVAAGTTIALFEENTRTYPFSLERAAKPQRERSWPVPIPQEVQHEEPGTFQTD